MVKGLTYDSLRAANSASTHGVFLVRFCWGIEQPRNHAHASILDFRGLRVLLVIDEVLRQSLGHELLDLFLLDRYVSSAIYVSNPRQRNHGHMAKFAIRGKESIPCTL